MNYRKHRPWLTFSFLLALFVIASGQTNSPTIQLKSRPNFVARRKALCWKVRVRPFSRTGITPTYFSKHFRVQQVVNKTGDRRVVWKFSINEYDTIIVDSIGYYTEGGKRVNVHGVESLLLATSDITRTISKARALKIMKSCLGAFANPVVEYKADGSRKAVLVLNAHSIPKSDSPAPNPTPESKKTEASPDQNDRDRIREGRQKPRPPIELGSVNLETGKCVKGIGQAGAPKPPI